MDADILECFRILDLEPGARPEEVKRAYRDLVKVWHPDRFPNDSTLQKKASEKLKLINSAYEKICSAQHDQGFQKATRPSASSPASPPHGTQQSRRSQPNPPPDSTGARQNTPPTSRPKETHWAGRITGFLAAAIVISFLKSVIFQNDQPANPTNATPTPYSQLPPTLNTSQLFVAQSGAIQTPTKHVSLAQLSVLYETALKIQPDFQMTREEFYTRFSRFAQDRLTNYDFSEGLTFPSPAKPPADADQEPFKQNTNIAALPHVVLPPPRNPEPTVLLNRPSDPNRFDNAPPATRTVETNPPQQQVPSHTFFTVGSTKGDVLSAQGTPDNFSKNSFQYGLSSVYFKGDHVESWHQNQYNPLKAKLLPKTQVQGKGYFTVGSTKDEVLVVQGTPDHFTETAFQYGLSSVTFRRDRVESWHQNQYNPLKAKLLPKTQVQAKGYFTVGSTKDEVLAIQGTPDHFTETAFQYGLSSVTFRRDRVQSWHQNPSNPLRARLGTPQNPAR